MVECVHSNHTDSPCPASYHISKIYTIDTANLQSVKTFYRTYSYDPTQLVFLPDATSLLCDLRSASALPFCPNFPPGSGTAPISNVIDAFTVDQTGLTITIDPTGLPSFSVGYTAPAGSSFTGERNFLALAFDLLPHYDKGAIATYGPAPMVGETFASGPLECWDASGVSLPCGASNPPSAVRIDPVPAPLAVTGLPVMVHASRRLRRRVRLAAATR